MFHLRANIIAGFSSVGDQHHPGYRELLVGNVGYSNSCPQMTTPKEGGGLLGRKDCCKTGMFGQKILCGLIDTPKLELRLDPA